MKALLNLFRPKATEPCEPCQSCELRRVAMIRADENVRLHRGAHQAMSRRASNLLKDHPELWRLYFTRAGEAERTSRKEQ